MGSARILVVGSSNTDMVVKSRKIPSPGETVTGGEFVLAPGGKGANQAVAAARLGASVTFVAKVGSDMFGEQAIEGYAKEGIDTAWILSDADSHTGVALILVDDSGENLISVASGANHKLTPQNVERAVEPIREADIVMLQLESPMDVVIRTVQLASEAEVPVILDPAPAPDDPLDAELLRHVTYLTPNETEATGLTGIEVTDEGSAREAATKLLDMGVDNVIITLGTKGALVATSGGMDLVPSREVAARDSTAAGDAFNGGLAVALASGQPLADAVQEASLVGALSVTKLGAQPSLPTRAELENFAQS
jgi:ribokinase